MRHWPAIARRAQRIQASLPVTVSPLLGDGVIVCRTRDLSELGVGLDTAAPMVPGTRVSLALMDAAAGQVIEMAGEIVRAGSRPSAVLGVLLVAPPPEWAFLVARLGAGRAVTVDVPRRRLRVLVIGDEHRQRGAMALYVSSGWDVLFAHDLDSVGEALRELDLDAAVAEHDRTDERWREIMTEIKRTQPLARRIVRGTAWAGADDPLVHRFVDRDAGFDALLSALESDPGRA
ncbi:MAG: PilZ domain-containing protein [Kofleriaceae bacterium]